MGVLRLASGGGARLPRYDCPLPHPLHAMTPDRAGAPAPDPYIGRFAPSPSGPLHAGSVATALASWLDARAHHGRWLLRIEDIDPPRIQPGATAAIVQALTTLGLHWDEPYSLQSNHEARFEEALNRLIVHQLAYPCGCTRREIAAISHAHGAPRAPDQDIPYPGTCRQGLPTGRVARAWRLRVPPGVTTFVDRHRGLGQQDVAQAVGDFVLRRADGPWAYQLAVVVDDAAQGVTDIVRGADLLDSTARQRVLAAALDLPYPRTLHVPLVCAPDGAKLSKHHGAPAVDLHDPIKVLSDAMRHLGLEPPTEQRVDTWLSAATQRWAQRYGPLAEPASGVPGLA